MKEALLVIDVQNGVVQNAWHRNEVIETINKLVTKARSHHVMVIWVQHHDEYLIQGSKDWQIVEELHPLSDEIIIQKTWGDAFAETDLLSVLKAHQIQRLIITGAQSDACIRMTKYGALHRGFYVRLVGDAHTTESGNFAGTEFSAQWVIAYENAVSMNSNVPDAKCELVDSSNLWQ
jgi:nicotinamidase-related amidase